MPDCLRSFVAAAAAALLVAGAPRHGRFQELRARSTCSPARPSPAGSRWDLPPGGRRTARSSRPRTAAAGSSPNRAYQDVAFSASFRCADGCSAGVLLRAERTPDGGLKGIYASLVADDLVSYRVTIDSTGKETSRDRLRPAGGGQVRVAPPPAPLRRLPCRGTDADAARRTGAAGRGAGGRGAGPQPLQMPGGIEPPIARPVIGLQSGQWNDSRARPRCQHPARVSQRRRRLERRRRRRRVRPLRRDRALRRRYGGGPLQGRGGEGSPAASRAAGTGLAPLPHAGAQRVLLLVGALGRRHQQGRRSRHRRRAVLLPGPRLRRRARDLHGEDARRQHAVLQRRAVRATTSPATAGRT